MQLWNAARTQGLHGCTFFTKSALPLEKVQEVQEIFNRDVTMTCPWFLVYFPGNFFAVASVTTLPKKSAYDYSWFGEKTPARKNIFLKFFCDKSKNMCRCCIIISNNALSLKIIYNDFTNFLKNKQRNLHLNFSNPFLFCLQILLIHTL